MLYEWTESEDPESGFGQGSVRTAIICSFLSIYAWVCCQFPANFHYLNLFRVAVLSLVGRGTNRVLSPPFQMYLMVNIINNQNLHSNLVNIVSGKWYYLIIFF